jgi:hypothetical protein
MRSTKSWRMALHLTRLVKVSPLKRIQIRTPLIFFASIVLILFCVAGPAQETAQSEHDLMKDVVYNELQDRSKQSFWEYRVEKRVGSETLVEYQVETADGPVHVVLSNLGSPLTEEQRRQEQARQAALQRDPSLQARVKQKHDDDEQKLERLMKVMPDAFIFKYDGTDEGLTRLKFTPDPSYSPPTYEAKAIHGLGGTVWIDPRQKRLVHLRGTIVDRVDFGFGLLGHIEKGGTFELRRQQVTATHWKTSLLDLRISAKAILFKTISRDQREVRSDFKPVPLSTTMQQGIQLLAQQPISSPSR